MLNQVELIRAAYRCGNAGCSCQSGSNVHCPVHTDRNPSFGVDEDKSKPGRVLVKCRSGCDQSAIIAKIKDDGFSLDGSADVVDLSARRGGSSNVHPDEKMVALYDYTTTDGKPLFQKGRFEFGPKDPETGKRDKSFKWRTAGTDKWTGLGGRKIDEVPLWQPVQVLEWIKAKEPIYFVEGESAAEALIDKGLAATCGAWGASQKDFGDSLNLLHGANVILWPDNDEAGRNYMKRIHAGLKEVAASIRFCTPPVDEKGDAADYFRKGGTVEALEKQTPPTRPVIDRIGHDHIIVRYPSVFGVILLEFSDMERTNRSLETELTITIPNRQEAISQRINITSSSARDGLRRDLDGLTDTKNTWAEILLSAFAIARQAYLGYDRSVKLSQIEPVPELSFLIDTVIPEGQHTVLFADGSSGKTFLTFRMAVSVAAGIPFLGFKAKTRGVLVADYENNEQTFRYRMDRVIAGLREEGHQIPNDLPISYWRSRGIPLPEQADALRRKIEADNIGLLIVDSAAAACGGEPENAAIALRYFTAGLDKLGDSVSTVTIAHVPKGGDTSRPFGSAFWQNQPRRSWYIERDQRTDADEISVVMHCRKVNDGALPGAITLAIRFGPKGGPVSFIREESRVTAGTSGSELVTLIYRTLNKPRTVKDIADLVSAQEPTIRKILADPRNKHIFEQAAKGGGRGNATYWQRTAKEATDDPKIIRAEKFQQWGDVADKGESTPYIPAVQPDPVPLDPTGTDGDDVPF